MLIGSCIDAEANGIDFVLLELLDQILELQTEMLGASRLKLLPPLVEIELGQFLHEAGYDSDSDIEPETLVRIGGLVRPSI